MTYAARTAQSRTSASPGRLHGSDLGKRLWPVQCTNAWPTTSKRLGLRYDRLDSIVESMF